MYQDQIIYFHLHMIVYLNEMEMLNNEQHHAILPNDENKDEIWMLVDHDDVKYSKKDFSIDIQDPCLPVQWINYPMITKDKMVTMKHILFHLIYFHMMISFELRIK